MHADSDHLNDLSGRMIGSAFTVLNTLGAGFLEKVYGRDVVVGEYAADLLVEDALLVELKAVSALD